MRTAQDTMDGWVVVDPTEGTAALVSEEWINAFEHARAESTEDYNAKDDRLVYAHLDDVTMVAYFRHGNDGDER